MGSEGKVTKNYSFLDMWEISIFINPRNNPSLDPKHNVRKRCLVFGTMVFFLLLVSGNSDDQLSPNVHRDVVVCIM